MHYIEIKMYRNAELYATKLMIYASLKSFATLRQYIDDYRKKYTDETFSLLIFMI